MKPKSSLHIFQAGRQTDMSGRTIEFSAADLAGCVAAYDPTKHEAPLVVGHPRHDLPAYGWVKSLVSDERGLYAEPQQVNADFAELVNGGAYKKISASFYTPDAKNNPVPGSYYLRHVGFLGAQPPAVKGLHPPQLGSQFAELEDGVIEFAEWEDRVEASLWRRLRDFLIGDKGLEVADGVIPDYSVAALEARANQPDAEAVGSLPAFSESAIVKPTDSPSTTIPPIQFAEEAAVTPEELKALQDENAAIKQQLAATLAAGRHKEHSDYAETLIAAGTLAPKDRELVVGMLDFAETGAAPLEFGEGDAKQPLATAFKTFLSGLPKVVEFGEHATKEKVSDTIDFADPQAIATAATQYQKQQDELGTPVKFEIAVAHVASRQR